MEAFSTKYFQSFFKFIVSTNFVSGYNQGHEAVYFTTGVVYCSLNSTMQEQWFSNLGGNQNPLEGLINSPGPIKSGGLGWDPALEQVPRGCNCRWSHSTLLSYCRE